MSFILDALKKAERERRFARIPTLETMHRTPPVLRRRLWPWVVALVVLVDAAALVWLLRPTPDPSSVSPARLTSTPAASAPAALSGEPPADRAPHVSPAEKPAASAAAPPQPAPAPPAPPVVSEKPAASIPVSPLPPVVSAPDKPVAPRVDPSPRKPMERGTGSLQDAPPWVMPEMKLQVLVYSDLPADRAVYINDHRYVEGQSIDGKVVVESITRDGAVLSYQGKRFMLRQQ